MPTFDLTPLLPHVVAAATLVELVALGALTYLLGRARAERTSGASSRRRRAARARSRTRSPRGRRRCARSSRVSRGAAGGARRKTIRRRPASCATSICASAAGGSSDGRAAGAAAAAGAAGRGARASRPRACSGRGTCLAPPRPERTRMTVGDYIAASGGMAALARLEAVAHNLANANTAGYKAERPVFRLRQDVQPPPGEPLRMTAGAQVVQADTVFDFSTGPIQATGNPLDVAIPGREFFAVRTDAGERYTRQGIFRLDPEGYLVTASGARVQGANGDLRLPPGGVEIAENGAILVDGIEAGRLKLVRFPDPPPLVPQGDALFAPKPGTTG